MVAIKPQGGDDPYAFVNIASWLVFLADLVVHLRLKHRLPAHGPRPVRPGDRDPHVPLVPDPRPGQHRRAAGLAWLGRIGRLIIAGGTTHVLRRLIARLGKAGLYSLALIVTCSEVVYRAEPPSSGFATQFDAIWWGFVTFTTVGYGDLVPVTATGRSAVHRLDGGRRRPHRPARRLAGRVPRRERCRRRSAGRTAPRRAARHHVLLDELRSLRGEVAALAGVDRGRQ